jgi:hypothetical protein
VPWLLAKAQVSHAIDYSSGTLFSLMLGAREHALSRR